MEEKNKFALVPKPPSAVEKAAPGAQRILLQMTSETLTLARKAEELRRQEAESVFQQSSLLFKRADEKAYENHWNFDAKWASDEFQAGIKCLRKAAHLGHAVAQRELGLLYLQGQGVRTNNRAALRWFLIAAKQGDGWAARWAAACYQEGSGVKRDINRAVEYYCKAMENGCIMAYWFLGRDYLNGREGFQKDVEEAIRWFTRGVEAGERHWSANQLGYLYRAGQEVPRDYVEAAKWYKIAAEGGCARSATTLGQLYVAGHGVERNEAEAAKWFHRAAEKAVNGASYPECQFELGRLYLEGRGVNRDAAQAAVWFHLAADDANVEACEMLGMCYERGWGVPHDLPEAFVWYSLASDGGSSSAHRRVQNLAKEMTPDQIRESRDRYRVKKELNQLARSARSVVGKCPLCAGHVRIFFNHYSCLRTGCGYCVHRLVNHHDITPSEMQSLLADGHTDVLGDLISKSATRFSARLILNRNSGQITVEERPA